MTKTAEVRDVAGEHITLDEQAALVLKYRTTLEGMKTLVRELAEENIWAKLEHNKHECVICGRIVEGRDRYGIRANANFGRTSHGNKHVRDGTAISKWGGADGIFIMPSRAKVVREIERKIKQRRIDKQLPALRAARKPYVTTRQVERRVRDGLEQKLLDLIRNNGMREREKVSELADDISEQTDKINRLSAEIEAIESEYDAEVIGQLTLGDL